MICPIVKVVGIHEQHEHVIIMNMNHCFLARQFYQKYDPKEVLGKGLSSVVRKCVEKASGKEFACKIIEFNDDNQDERNATLREIQILKLAGGHPNIIDIIASFETPNYVFIVMELCPYGELFDYLTKVVRLSGKCCSRLFVDV
jgi:phosphorylase kinase gamma subunit